MFSSASSIGSRLKNWKMKPMCSRRSRVSARVVERAQLGAGDRDRARGRLVEAREQVHQRGLARARRAHDGDELAGAHVEIDTAERVHGRARPRRTGDAAHRRSRSRRRRCRWIGSTAPRVSGRSERHAANGRPRGCCSIVRPMHETDPSVFLIARPSIDVEGMRGYLTDVGGESWLERRLEEADGGTGGNSNRGELLVEFGGPGLLPQLGAGAEPERQQGPHRSARVLREHPALRPRQRARARQLLVRAAQREPRLHP